MSVSPRVLLTPLAISDDQGHFVCIAIRDPETDEIVDTVVTNHDLSEKAGPRCPVRVATPICCNTG